MMESFLGPRNIRSDFAQLERTNPAHLSGKLHPVPAKPVEKQDFGAMVTGALNQASDTVQHESQLSQQFITDPDSVDVHDVTIAMSKANMAVSMTKTVVDQALRAYREIMNIR